MGENKFRNKQNTRVQKQWCVCSLIRPIFVLLLRNLQRVRQQNSKGCRYLLVSCAETLNGGPFLVVMRHCFKILLLCYILLFIDIVRD